MERARRGRSPTAGKPAKEAKPVAAYVVALAGGGEGEGRAASAQGGAGDDGAGAEEARLECSAVSYDSNNEPCETDGSLRVAAATILAKHNTTAPSTRTPLQLEDAAVLRAAGRDLASHGFGIVWTSDAAYNSARVEHVQGALGVYIVPRDLLAAARELIEREHFGGSSPARPRARRPAVGATVNLHNAYISAAKEAAGDGWGTAAQAAAEKAYAALTQQEKEQWYTLSTGRTAPASKRRPGSGGGGGGGAAAAAVAVVEDKELLERSRRGVALEAWEEQQLAAAWARACFGQDLLKLNQSGLTDLLELLAGKRRLAANRVYKLRLCAEHKGELGAKTNAARLSLLSRLFQGDWLHPSSAGITLGMDEDLPGALVGDGAVKRIFTHVVVPYTSKLRVEDELERLRKARERASSKRREAARIKETRRRRGSRSSSGSDEDEDEDEEDEEDEYEQEGSAAASDSGSAKGAAADSGANAPADDAAPAADVVLAADAAPAADSVKSLSIESFHNLDSLKDTDEYRAPVLEEAVGSLDGLLTAASLELDGTLHNLLLELRLHAVLVYLKGLGEGLSEAKAAQAMVEVALAKHFPVRDSGGGSLSIGAWAAASREKLKKDMVVKAQPARHRTPAIARCRASCSQPGTTRRPACRGAPAPHAASPLARRSICTWRTKRTSFRSCSGPTTLAIFSSASSTLCPASSWHLRRSWPQHPPAQPTPAPTPQGQRISSPWPISAPPLPPRAVTGRRPAARLDPTTIRCAPVTWRRESVSARGGASDRPAFVFCRV